MIDAAARTERLTMIVVAAVGFLIFLIMIGVSGGMAYSKYGRSQSWPQVMATVEQIDRLCEVEQKSGKSWELVGAMTCAEAAKLVAERTSVLTPWRSTEWDYAAIAYDVAGTTHRQTLRASNVSDAPLAVGDQTPMIVNPANAEEVERPFSGSDMRTFWTVFTIAVGIWILTAIVGYAVAKLNRRFHARAAAKTAAAGWGAQ